MIDLFFNLNLTVKLCIKISLELSIWLMSSSLLINAKKWVIHYVIQVSEMLLLVQENNNGPLLWTNLPEFIQRSLVFHSIKWWKSFGVIISLMLKQRNGNLKDKVMKENQLKEHLLNLLWIQFANFVTLLWMDKKNNMKKCLKPFKLTFLKKIVH